MAEKQTIKQPQEFSLAEDRRGSRREVHKTFSSVDLCESPRENWLFTAVLSKDLDGQAVAELGLAFGHDAFAGFEPGEDFGPAVVLEAGLDFAGGG